MILIDTSAMIEFLNRTGAPADRTIAHLISTNTEVALSEITLTEILQGIKNDREYREVKASLLSFPCLSLKGRQSYLAAAELFRTCRKKGFTIRSTIDLLIAQTALEHGARLVHHDRDFNRIAGICGLKIYPLLP